MTTTDIPTSTSSKLTRRLGFVSLLSMGIFLALALVISPPEISQQDAVRLFYLHVPTATIAFYFAPGIIAVGSVMYLWKKSTFWDLAAGAAGELAVIFCAFTLATGMLWGKPTWGLYWTWEPRLTATAVSFVLFVGYLAVRKLDLDPVLRSQRAAVLGIVAAANTLLVRYSVQIWKGVHQGTTISPLNMQISGLMWGTALVGFVSFTLVFVWLLIHRFRVAWLEHQVEAVGLDLAIIERRAEREGIDDRTTPNDVRLTGEGA